MEFSPLFWPVELKGRVIYVLDETLLPQKVKYIKVKNYKQACRLIKEMKTRAVGQVILAFYAFLISAGKTDLNVVAEAINATRPTLHFKFITDIVLGWQKSGAPIEKSILRFLEMLKGARIKQAESAANLLKDKDTVLTHCNVSGLMPMIADFCRKQGKEISFYVTETRPYLQGARLSTWELQQAGFPVTLICDNMAAQVMSEGKVNKVIVGADHLAKNGDIANKTGTLQLAILALHFNIPFYVLCPPPSAAANGSQIKIEVRPEEEMLVLGGRRIAPKGVKGYYPAFDVTPVGLITKHIYLEMK